MFCGYDGTVFLEGHRRLPWHNFPIRAEAVQPLPRFLRKYPPTYGKFQKSLLSAYKRLCRFLGREG